MRSERSTVRTCERRASASSAAAGAEANTDTASTPGAPASAAPTAPATASYTAPADNQVAPLLTVTHVPQGHSLVENTDNNSRLTFATASTADDTTLESGSAYMIRLADEGTTVDTVIQGNAELSTLDASAFTTTGEASVDGETALVVALARGPEGSATVPAVSPAPAWPVPPCPEPAARAAFMRGETSGGSPRPAPRAP